METKKALLIAGTLAAAAVGTAYALRLRRRIPGASAAHAAAAAAYASTRAAFSPSGADVSEFDARDAQARADADALRAAAESVMPALPPELAAKLQSFLDNVAAAQVQVMAFAINRKNHGVPDAAHTKTEAADLAEFERSNQPLLNELLSSLR